MDSRLDFDQWNRKIQRLADDRRQRGLGNLLGGVGPKDADADLHQRTRRKAGDLLSRQPVDRLRHVEAAVGGEPVEERPFERRGGSPAVRGYVTHDGGPGAPPFPVHARGRGQAGISPERVMEYGSYHAIVACVAAGSGIAVVPRSVIRAVRPEKEVRIHPLPKDIAAAKTQLVWRAGHRSSALDALRATLGAAPATPAAASRASRSASPRRPSARPPRRSSAPAASR